MPHLRNVPFVAGLGQHGNRLAVVTPDGAELTYAQLAARVADEAARLGGGRRLVAIAAANELEPLVTYLAALATGHPVLLAAPGAAQWDPLVAAYDPDVLLRKENGEWRLRERRAGSAHELHPELAVLLSTSGSTGSPKLVRLSAASIQANAESIADYLDIRDTDRASAALPMHYCYGLSVVNSNLLRGAALLLSTDSVVDERFWTTFRAHGGTSLHGVPYTFDLLERVGFERMDLPALRYVTQAGGALAPDRVRHLAGLGARRGWRFFVMYGQTEATARMAYLPPELAAAHPECIGIPVPGGSFDLLPSDVPGQGELVYRGPNVMLGYAESPADLAAGRTVAELRTGDIARRTAAGLYQVVGRRSRFIKPFGLRIDLARTERILAGHGYTAAATGSDDGLVVAVQSADPAPVAAAVRRHLGLPDSHIRVAAVGSLPRLPTGKIDYPAVERLTRAPKPGPRRGERSVRERFAVLLGHPDPADTDTFVSLGGDSLSYVQMSLELERILGYLPRDWHTTPIGELARLEPRPGRHPVRFTVVETDIVLRALAITLIVGTHAWLFEVLGGAHLLLAIAGWCFARFCLARAGPATGILRSAARIAIPSMLWLSWRAVETTDVGLPNILLVNNYVRVGAPGYWFVEALVQTLLLLAILFAVPAVRRFERRHGFAFALALLGAALLVNQFARDTAVFPERVMATHGVLWFFVLGWLAHRATTPARKLLVLGLAALLIPGYFNEPARDAVVLAGLAVLLLVPRLWLPRLVVLAVAPVASASLYIYLIHYAVLDRALHHLPAGAILAISLAAGVLVWLTAQHIQRALPAVQRRAAGSARRVMAERRGSANVYRVRKKHQTLSPVE